MEKKAQASLSRPPIPRRQEFLDELLSKTEDPVHKRLLRAYGSDDPIQAMEAELGRVLREILEHED